MKPHVYAQMKGLLDHASIAESFRKTKRTMERAIAKCTSVPGANCAASDASMAHRMILASFGLVPRHLDICAKPPSEEQTSAFVKRLIHAIQAGAANERCQSHAI